jgi:hypothetical protein
MVTSVDPEMPKKPVAFFVKMKFAFIGVREAFNSVRVPTVAPARAFPDTVKLLRLSAISGLRTESERLITSLANCQFNNATIANDGEANLFEGIAYPFIDLLDAS